MSESAHFPMSTRSMVVVYVWLVVLTLAEVGIVMAGIPRTAGVILMAGTTLAKTLFITLYFMHMKEDRPLVWLLPGIPVALAVLFVLALFPDIVYHLTLLF